MIILKCLISPIQKARLKNIKNRVFIKFTRVFLSGADNCADKSFGAGGSFCACEDFEDGGRPHLDPHLDPHFE